MADDPKTDLQPREPKYDYSAVTVVFADSFQVNIDQRGNLKIGFGTADLNTNPAKPPDVIRMGAAACIPPYLHEQFFNAMGMIANRLNIKLHPTIM